MIPVRKDQRPIMAGRSHLLEPRSRDLDLLEVCVPTSSLFDIRRDHVCRESLIEPELRPINAGHQVAPPLMRQLVSAQAARVTTREDRSSVILWNQRETVHFLTDAVSSQDL